MPQKAPGKEFRTDKGLFAVMALTVPCPVSILFCNGLLTLTALGGFVGAAAVRAPRDPGYFIMTPLAIEGLVYLWLMWWAAGRLAARMSTRGRRVAVAGLVVSDCTECQSTLTLTRQTNSTGPDEDADHACKH